MAHCCRVQGAMWNNAATLGTLKTGCLIEVGHLIEVQYKLGRNGSQHNFIASV